MHQRIVHTKQPFKAFHTTTVAHKPYKHEAKLKICRFIENTKKPSFPYLENASQRHRHLSQQALQLQEHIRKLENSGIDLK